MKLKTFFKKLDKFYSDIDNAGVVCKFYAQCNTFRYELYKIPDRMVLDLTSSNRAVYRSEMFSYWVTNPMKRKHIICTIIENIKKYSK